MNKKGLKMKLFSSTQRDWGDVFLSIIAIMLGIVLVPASILLSIILFLMLYEVITKGINFCA